MSTSEPTTASTEANGITGANPSDGAGQVAVAGPSRLANSTHLERSASEKDLSFIILGDNSSSCQSVGSCQSLPDLTGNQLSNIPPSYYQICLSDLIQLKTLQQQEQEQEQQPAAIENENQVQPTSPSPSASLTQRITDEVIVLREENIRLAGMAMKNDQSLRSIVAKHQSLGSQLAELSKDNAALRKQNISLEDKVETAMNEIKLICSDLAELKAVNHFLKEENLHAKNDSLKVIADMDASKERQNMPNRDNIGQLESSSSSSIDASIDSCSVIRALEQRIATLECRLAAVGQQNVEIGHQLHDCLHRVATEERAKTELADKLNYMNDNCQLLQLKVFTLESKMTLHKSQLSSPTVQSPTIQIPSSPQPGTTLAGIPHLYPDPHSVAQLSPPINQPVSYRIQEVPDSRYSTTMSSSSGEGGGGAGAGGGGAGGHYSDGFSSLKQKLIALVSPLKMDRQLSSNHQASAPPVSPSINSINTDRPPLVTNYQQHEEPSASVEEQSQRRHRRHHRIKLFPSRRRH